MAAARKRATPLPNEALRELRGRLRRGWPPGLTVLCGNDLYHMDQAQRALLAALLPAEAPDLALTIFGGDEKVDVRTVVGAAQSLAMFADRRVVLVRDAAALDGPPDALASFAAQPPDGGYLIIRAAKLDRRRKLHATLAGGGVFCPFELPGEDNLRPLAGDARQLAKDRGLTLDSQSTEFLLTAHQGDLYRVSAELDKIRAWLGESGGKVTLDTVRQVDPAGGALGVFDLSHAVQARDRERALVLARRLVESGTAPLSILGTLGWKARTMLQAKAMQARGAREDDIVSAARAWRQRKELLAGLARYEMDELLAFPAALLAADRTLKSRGIAPRAILENLVDRLTTRRPA